jgi:hypothetical protein
MDSEQDQLGTDGFVKDDAEIIEEVEDPELAEDLLLDEEDPYKKMDKEDYNNLEMSAIMDPYGEFGEI